MYETIPEFLSSVADKYPTKYALYIRRFLRTTRFTYREVEQLSFKIANYLLENSLKPQDKVLIWAPNMPEWVLALFGCLSAGIVVVPVGLHSTVEVVEKYIDQTKPKILFLSKFYPIDLKNNEYKNIKRIYLEEIIDLVENVELKKLPHISKSELAEIVFTSGTTGEPKGVMISHHNILYEIEQLLKTVPKYKHFRLLSVLPLSHVMEQVIGLMTPLARGGTIYYIPRINTVTIRKALQKYQITDLGVVPQMLRMFLDTIEYQINEQKETILFNVAIKVAPILPIFFRRLLFGKIHEGLGGKLYVFGVGSAPLDVKLAQVWEAMGIKVVEGYGASEMTGGVTANRIDGRKLGSVGKKIPGMDIKLSSEGEILVKAENVTKGYFENEEKTKESFTSDGYFKSGDVGYFKDEYLYISGREKFKIVTAAGDKIYPEDIERKLNANPNVWDSCVFGIKKGDGEIVYATVILKEKSKQKLEDIINNINKNLEVNQQIMDFSLWPEKDFSRLHTLKVDRNQVKQIIEKQKSGEKVELTPTTENKDKLKEILSKVCKVPIEKINEDTNLVSDLKLDSLKRVELVSLIEEEFDQEIDEAGINNTTNVKTLRSLIHNGIKNIYPYDIQKIVSFIRNSLNKKIKIILQDILLFPIFNFFVHTKLIDEVRLGKLSKPVVFIGNHPAPNDVVCLLQALPRQLRENMVAPSDDSHWNQKTLIARGNIISLLGGAFPINKRGGPITESMEAIMDFIDDKYNLLILPEGAYTPEGKKLGELHRGIEALFVGTKTLLVPYYISGNLHKTFPLEGGAKHFFPHGFSEVTLKIGEPFTLEDINESQARETIKNKLLQLEV